LLEPCANVIIKRELDGLLLHELRIVGVANAAPILGLTLGFQRKETRLNLTTIHRSREDLGGGSTF
jgi:hypothetical protein